MSNVISTTPWFSGDEKPLSDKKYIGPYERDYEDSKLFCWWDGEVFGVGTFSPKLARLAYKIHGRSGSQNLPWRGVMK